MKICQRSKLNWFTGECEYGWKGRCMCVYVYVCLCMCVCERGGEREREGGRDVYTLCGHRYTVAIILVGKLSKITFSV